MTIIGEQKQEKKLKEIAELAKVLFPEANEIAIKGALRYGAKDALEKCHFSDWKDLADQPPSVRKAFFNTMLENAKPRIEMEIGKNNISVFFSKISQLNEKYVND